MAKQSPKRGTKAGVATQPAQGAPVSANGKPAVIQRVPLEQLHFDKSNPRFGTAPLEGRSEAEVLDEIVNRYGVEGVIDSLAANGYLETEPLVGLKKAQGIEIAEGNRRLAALLILANDPRANKHRRLHQLYADKIRKPIREVPVIVYDEATEPAALLPYLGVKHIVGPKEWDSYAKAAWIARALEEGKGRITLNEIELMIGDRGGTVKKMLESYYLVEQLRNEGRFQPADSMRKGRGSNPDYPFSWVYNALMYKDIRSWLALPEGEPRKEPLSSAGLERGAKLLTYLFGNSSLGKEPAISDSREIADLAKSLPDAAKARLLDKGQSIEEVDRMARPPEEKLSDSLYEADQALTDAWVAVGELDWQAEKARRIEPAAAKVRKRAIEIHKKILENFAPPDE